MRPAVAPSRSRASPSEIVRADETQRRHRDGSRAEDRRGRRPAESVRDRSVVATGKQRSERDAPGVAAWSICWWLARRGRRRGRRAEAIRRTRRILAERLADRVVLAARGQLVVTVERSLMTLSSACGCHEACETRPSCAECANQLLHFEAHEGLRGGDHERVQGLLVLLRRRATAARPRGAFVIDRRRSLTNFSRC